MKKIELVEKIRSEVLKHYLKSETGMRYAERRIVAGLENAQAEYNAWACCASLSNSILVFIDKLTNEDVYNDQINVDEVTKAAEIFAKGSYCSAVEELNDTGMCDSCQNMKDAFVAGANYQKEKDAADIIATWKDKVYTHTIGDSDEEMYCLDGEGEDIELTKAIESGLLNVGDDVTLVLKHG